MRPQQSTELEVRYVPVELEVRAAKGDEPARVVGHAAVFDKWSQDLGGFLERVRPGAFTRALASSDVRALFNHDPRMVLGRAKAGTLTLEEDAKGLRFEVTPPDTQWARDLLVSMQRGDINQTSFQFTVDEDAWYEEAGKKPSVRRDIVAVRNLLDVSVVTYPAYTQTSAQVRSVLDTYVSQGSLPGSEPQVSPPEDRGAPRPLSIQMAERYIELLARD